MYRKLFLNLENNKVFVVRTGKEPKYYGPTTLATRLRISDLSYSSAYNSRYMIVGDKPNVVNMIVVAKESSRIVEEQ